MSEGGDFLWGLGFRPVPHKLLPAGTPCSRCQGSGGSQPDNHDDGCPDCGGSGAEPVTRKYEMCGVCEHIIIEARNTTYPGIVVSGRCGVKLCQVWLNSPACEEFDLMKKAVEGE